MSIENNNVSMQTFKGKSKLPDREAAIRSKPHTIPWNSKMVEDLIIGKVEDAEIRKIVIRKLKRCPDGALENFVKNIEQKIYESGLEISQKVAENKAAKLTQPKNEYTVDDILNIRDQLFDVEEEKTDEQPPSENNL